MRDDHHLSTVTGARIWPLEPECSEIDWLAVAVGAANTCRFAGQLWQFYSVAQHEILVSERVEWLARQRGHTKDVVRYLAIQALVHDAAEGLGFGDLPSPIKRHPSQSGYRAAEKAMQTRIAFSFGHPPPRWQPAWNALIKHADLELLLTESFCLRGVVLSDADVAAPGVRALPMRIKPLDPNAARRAWLRRLWELMPEVEPRIFRRVGWLWFPRLTSRAVPRRVLPKGRALQVPGLMGKTSIFATREPRSRTFQRTKSDDPTRP